MEIELIAAWVLVAIACVNVLYQVYLFGKIRGFNEACEIMRKNDAE